MQQRHGACCNAQARSTVLPPHAQTKPGRDTTRLLWPAGPSAEDRLRASTSRNNRFRRRKRVPRVRDGTTLGQRWEPRHRRPKREKGVEETRINLHMYLESMRRSSRQRMHPYPHDVLHTVGSHVQRVRPLGGHALIPCTCSVRNIGSTLPNGVRIWSKLAMPPRKVWHSQSWNAQCEDGRQP